jgi:hypothetical protein
LIGEDDCDLDAFPTTPKVAVRHRNVRASD